MASKKTAFLKAGKDTGIELLIKKKQPVVHSTFRLSQGAHNAIKQLTDFMGVKNAELFDNLLEFFERREKTKNPVPLAETNEKSESVRKTYVVKKETLVKLNKLISAKNTTRDLLIERAALAFNKSYEEALSDEKERYRNVLKTIIEPFYNEAESVVEKKLLKELGPRDPITHRFGYVVNIFMDLRVAIENYLNNGTPIESDDVFVDLSHPRTEKMYS